MDGQAAYIVPILLQALAGAGVGLAMVALYRYVARQSRDLGAIVAAGLILRLMIGLLLFTISYSDQPLLRGLHSGDGFWAVAPDARAYSLRAERAAAEGLDTIRPGSASPAFVKTLALWMRGTGPGPASGFFLNVFLYCVLCAVFVHVWKPRGERRHDLPCLVALASFSFAPGSLFHGTQALKDDLFTFLVVAGGIGAFLVLAPIVHGRQGTRSRWAAFLGLAALVLALYLLAGIRAYYAALMWACLAVTLSVFVMRPNLDRLRRGVPLAAVVLAITGVSWWQGAGVYNVVPRIVSAVVAGEGTGGPLFWAHALVARTGNVIAGARSGFARSGGHTNLASSQEAVRPGGARPPAAPPAVPRSPPAAAVTDQDLTPWTHLRRLLFGLGTLFVPISVLQSVSGVEVAGGRGLLFLTDVDTLFIDATILATLVLLWTRWPTARRHASYVTFTLMLGCLTALLLAYVVTNFGTLFRLRMLTVVPLWLLLLATSSAWTRPGGTVTSDGQVRV